MKFRYPEQVYNFISNPTDAWTAPMVEAYVEDAGLEWGEEFDIDELNEWIALEQQSIKEGYEKYLDNE
jgi:hypothetical protein|tara:strand:- start:16273 stop:16476 length:204 start_codon:yes stop_codon:yes gene_type:complete